MRQICLGGMRGFRSEVDVHQCFSTKFPFVPFVFGVDPRVDDVGVDLGADFGHEGEVSEEALAGEGAGVFEGFDGGEVGVEVEHLD